MFRHLEERWLLQARIENFKKLGCEQVGNLDGDICQFDEIRTGQREGSVLDRRDDSVNF